MDKNTQVRKAKETGASSVSEWGGGLIFPSVVFCFSILSPSWSHLWFQANMKTHYLMMREILINAYTTYPNKYHSQGDITAFKVHSHFESALIAREIESLADKQELMHAVGRWINIIMTKSRQHWTGFKRLLSHLADCQALSQLPDKLMPSNCLH